MGLYHVSRSTRIINYWKALPGNLLKKYPEQTIFYATFGVAALVGATYKLSKFALEYGIDGNLYRPYYRGFYDVIRSSDPLVSNWRKPEEYPPSYLASDIEVANTLSYTKTAM